MFILGMYELKKNRSEVQSFLDEAKHFTQDGNEKRIYKDIEVKNSKYSYKISIVKHKKPTPKKVIQKL